MRLPVALLSALLLSTSPAPPAPPTDPPSPAPAAPSPPRATAPVTRADLAHAYLALDAAVHHLQPQGERLAAIGRAFDAASASFFGGGQSELLRQLRYLTDSLTPNLEGEPAATAFSRSLRARIIPPVHILGLPNPPDPPAVHLDRLFPPAAGAPDNPVTLQIAVLPLGDTPRPHESVASARITLRPSDPLPGPIPLASFTTPLRPGRYAVTLSPVPGSSVVTAFWHVLDRSPDAARARNAAALDALEADGRLDTPDLRRAAAAFRSRNALLTSAPSLNDPAHIHADLAALMDHLDAELAALTQGRNPYADYPGDLWRTLSIAGADVPARLYNPPRPDPAPASPRPLVIALHGAGGDENMFPDGYGAGAIRRLADMHGFVLVSPRTPPFAADPAFFDALAAAVSADYPIDPARVYVVGHSFGGGIAGAWARLRPDAIAAAALITPFPPFSPTQRISPTLIVAAEEDTITLPDPILDAARTAAATGLPIEARLIPHQSHTLVVGATLPDTIPWLLTHTLTPPSPPPPPTK